MLCDGREAGHQCTEQAVVRQLLALVCWWSVGNLARRWRKPASDANELRGHDRSKPGAAFKRLLGIPSVLQAASGRLRGRDLKHSSNTIYFLAGSPALTAAVRVQL